MCNARILTPIPDFLWASGEVDGFDPGHPEFGIDDQGRRCLALDACIVPAIRALWDAGVATVSCCCGHGDGTNGVIAIRPPTALSVPTDCGCPVRLTLTTMHTKRCTAERMASPFPVYVDPN